MITLIAAMGRNREIGFENKLLWSISEDMKHFKEYTTGKVVVMGRKTFDSIGRTLPGRKNVIITTKGIPNILCVPSIDAALSIEHCYPELVIIGGETIYRQIMPLAHKLVITHIDAIFQADTFFPKICSKEWEQSSDTGGNNEKYNYRFTTYKRVSREIYPIGCLH